MNDFTKEELQIIHLDMTIYAEKTKLLKESPSHKALRDKVQRMIDNHCEHKDTRGVSEMDMDYRAICSECGVMV